MAAGAPIFESDLIAVNLNGLFEDYESFVDSIMLRISFTSLDELHGLLINKELYMNCKKKTVALSISEPFQAYAAQYPQSQAPFLPTPQGHVVQNLYISAPRQFNRGKGNNFRGNNNYRGNNYRGNSRGTSHSFNRNSGGYTRNSRNTTSH